MAVPQLHPAIDALVNQLRAIPQVRRVVLFGSRARGDAAERSDLDLAVDAPDADALVWDDIVQIVEDAPTLLPIDLVRLDRAAKPLAEEISTEGLVLYGATLTTSWRPWPGWTKLFKSAKTILWLLTEPSSVSNSPTS